MTENEQKMKEALIGFKDAYSKLLSVCYDAPEIALEDLYPFHRSFDELDVHAWVEQIIENMQRSAQEIQIDIRKQRLFAEYQLYYLHDETKQIVTFESSETGQVVLNPWLSECARLKVNPEEHYGEAYLNSDWTKKQFDLTREQMTEFICDLKLEEVFNADNLRHIMQHGLVGLQHLSNTDMRNELYATFEL